MDANVAVAAFAARGLCESVFELCLSNHEILLSEALLSEIRRNLAKKVRLDQHGIVAIERLLRENGTLFVPTAVPADADDLAILGLAEARLAEYIVTGDADLLVLTRFGACQIVTPRQFWSIVQRQ